MTLPLTTLRDLVGLPVAEVARLAQVSPAEVMEAERGRGPESVVDALVSAYGLDPRALAERWLSPSVEAGSALFFFQGASTTLQAEDLSPLLRALRWGRLWAISSVAADAQRQRLSFHPAAVRGDHPTAAAKEGHRLAQRVREALALGVEPIEDMVQLAEQRLGVPVCVERLRTRRLRAAAVIGPERSAAVAVINEPKPSAAGRVIVDIAHELCHILFDPLHQGAVRVALDHGDDADERILLESRARGFAAELLLPLGGMRATLGEPGEGGLDHARQQVRALRMRFGTSPELTINHLRNHGYFPEWVRVALLTEPSPTHTTAGPRLPIAGAVPLCLAELPPVTLETRTSEAEADPTAVRARGSLRATRRAVAELVVTTARDLSVQGRMREAGLSLSRFADDAQHAGDVEALQDLFELATNAELPIPPLRALLINTRQGQLSLVSRDRLISQVAEARAAAGDLEGDIRAWRARVA